ncbi:hypothetical protein [Sporosarcina sp.]|uniref:hypothetical protein n=1 Tax=Sporosarcina sp. TaxID=49982 RepID=UPI0026166864|nr:hypothetical protein [Sporosarcina sp.]
MAISYRRCPKCNSTDTMPILYGEPAEYLGSYDKKVKLGGCMVSPDDKEYYCDTCENEWTKEQAIDAAYRKIKGIHAEVGGYMIHSYRAEIDLAGREVLWEKTGYMEEKFIRTIEDREAKHFISQLKLIDFLNWKSSYIEPYILDGTQWSIEVIREGRTIKKYGSNAYPTSWLLFCELLSNITMREFG